MELGLSKSGEDDEHNGVSLMEIAKISVTQADIAHIPHCLMARLNLGNWGDFDSVT